MLSQNIDVTFKFGYGANELTLKCNEVVWGLQFIGTVEEDIDFNLVEDYDDVRMTVRCKLRLSAPEVLWMSSFLASDSKMLNIDGIDIDVVNDMQDLEFELWGDSNAASQPELKFRRKQPGLLASQVPTSATITGVTP